MKHEKTKVGDNLTEKDTCTLFMECIEDDLNGQGSDFTLSIKMKTLIGKVKVIFEPVEEKRLKKSNKKVVLN